MRPARAGVLAAWTACAAAAVVEAPAPEPAAASLPAAWLSGADFSIREPVTSDGLMRRYELASRFGDFSAYGREALGVRVHEVAALEQLSRNHDLALVINAAVRQFRDQVDTLKRLATHPVETVTGIPRGIAHLFGGYRAEADAALGSVATAGHAGVAPAAARAAQTAKTQAARYAERYLGVSAAERRFYQQLGVDPYTDNLVLRKTVRRAARIDAATSLAMHFAGVPGLPYVGDVQRAMTAIYQEDPAVLRARRRQTLIGYGLTPEEVKRFDDTLLLSPTRQSLLEEVARSLDGVAGRDELFRHAMEVDSVEEVQVFIRSAQLLARVHARHPVAAILSGLRLPAARSSDGAVVVCGAFDEIFWTADVARDEESLRAALPAGDAPRELWLTGSLSPEARDQLTRRQWVVHDQALEGL